MKKATLIGLFLVMFVVMTYQIIKTSLQSNLFTLMETWGEPGVDPYPWFSATLWDFYANFLLIACFVAWKENSWLRATLWIIFLGAMGSPGTALYVLVQLIKLKPNEGLKELFTTRKHAKS